MDRDSRPHESSRASSQPHSPRHSANNPMLLVGAVLAALLIVAGGSAVAYQSAYSDQLFPGVKVGDIEVGGMSKDAALAKLRPSLGERANRAMTIRGPEFLQMATAADLGATFDAAAAVEAAYGVGRSGSFLDRASTQAGAALSGRNVEAPGLHVDRSKLSAVISKWASQIDRPVRDTEIKVTDSLAVTVSPSVVGRKLDQSAAAAAIERALGSGAEAVDLPVIETAPKVTEKDVEDARARATKMLSGPVSLKFEDKSWSVSAKEIAAALTLEQKPGIPAPALTLKDDSFKKLVDKIAGELDQPKINARFDWNGGNPKLLRAGQDGRKLDRENSVSALLAAIGGDARTVQLPVIVDKATAANVDPASLGLKDLIESSTTSFYGSVPEKAHNIKTAAARLNGVLLAPGDVFSFNNELGPTTLKSGFQIGFGIAVANGEMQTVPSVAGGICQVATTLLHSVFNAGYQIEQRYPHAYWIPSYGLPPKGMTGLDATVDDPYLDFKFMNNTDNYLLIQTGVEGSTLQFALYGTKPKWKVEIDKPVISNVVKADPDTVRQEEPTWSVGRELWVERATDGMDVVVTRRVIDGNEVRTLNLKSHYEPSRNVLMVGTAPPPPTATPAPGETPAAAATAGTAPTATAPQPTATAGKPAPAATKPAVAPTPGH